jgi:membrane fusion protein, heavy metal efflux system
VASVRVQAGDDVSRGAVLATIHSHVVHDAWAAWFKALADRRQRQHELGFARDAEARAARLLAEKALAPQDLERAAAHRVAAEEALVIAGAEVTRAGQELEHYGITPGAEVDPRAQDAVPVTAPVSGTVVARLVSPGAAVTTGTPLFVVSDLRGVWVMAQLDERHAARITKGGAAAVSLGAYPGETFEGTIDAIGDSVDPATRRVTVRVAVPNPERRLKIDMFAAVVFGGAVRSVLVVPSSAVQQIEGETVVFVRRPDGRFHRQAIHAGRDVDGWVEAIDGVAEGDEVVSAGAFLLKSELIGPGDEEP